MKRISVKNKKIIAATAMTIFSLFAAVSGAYAWFVAKLSDTSTADDFVVQRLTTSVSAISIHEFYGTSTGSTKYYGFNPIPTGYIDYSDPANESHVGTLSISLEKYSPDDPHHPVLILFKVSGVNEMITGETTYPLLPKNKPGAATLDNNHIVSAYSGLEAKKANASDGEIFEVTNDEHQNGEYDDNGTTKKVTTRYAYNQSTNDFDLVWVNLGNAKNPLSSIIQTNSFVFNFDSPFVVNGNSFSKNGTLTAYAYTHYVNDVLVTESATEGIWIPVNDFKDPEAANTNGASFVNVTSGEFEQEITMFEGNVENQKYIGITVDYYTEALVYLSSFFMGNEYLNSDATFKCDWVTKV